MSQFTQIARWLPGLLFVIVACLAPGIAEAAAPEPGDKVKLTLHDGNVVQGELLGRSESGYRVSFAGTEVIVAYPSVAAIEVVQKDSLLEEMRPSQPSTYNPPARQPEPEQQQQPQRIQRYEAPTNAPGQVQPQAQPQQQRYQAPQSEPQRYQPPTSTPPPPPVPTRDTADIPPKPRSRGGGLMTTGFVLMGVGGALAISTAIIYDENYGYDYYDGYNYYDDGSGDYLHVLTAVGGIMATAGVIMGVTGIIMKSASGARRRRWERQYGALDLIEEHNLVVAPTISRDGDAGMALSFTF